MADLVARRVRRERSLRKKRVKAQKKSANIRKKYGPRRKPHPVVVKKMDTGEVVGTMRPRMKVSPRLDQEAKKAGYESYDAYLRSDHWRDLRKRVLARDYHKCVKCESEERLQVHHLSYGTLGREPLQSLLTLCERCHRATHRSATHRSKSRK